MGQSPVLGVQIPEAGRQMAVVVLLALPATMIHLERSSMGMVVVESSWVEMAAGQLEVLRAGTAA